MKRLSYTTSKEYKNSSDYNPSIKVHCRYKQQDIEFFINAGIRDNVSIWYDNDCICVLSWNRGWNYIGLQLFDFHQAYDSVVEYDSNFLQGEETDCKLGKNWGEYQDYTLRKKMFKLL